MLTKQTPPVSHEAKLTTGGWEWEYLDISLLDFGNARLSGGLNNGQLQLGAMASIWEPTITFKVFGVNISLGGNIGSIGAEIDIGTNSFKLSGALAIGIGIEIDWE